MGAGVAGALRRAAGEDLNGEAVSKAPIELGQVVVTDATASTFENRTAIFAAHQKSLFSEDAAYVIHAAAMSHGGTATERSIRAATQHTLEEADDLQCESFVMPAIGCGVAGFDFNDGVHIICETIADYDPYYLEDVTRIAYGDDEFDEMERIAEQYQ